MNLPGVDPLLCDFIPGLKRTDAGVSGWPDAVAVAAMRAKKPMPAANLGQLVQWPEWPLLRAYQRDGVRKVVTMLRSEGGCILADDMGLGKTVQSLTAWQALNMPKPLLICAPASVRRTWQEQFAKWAPSEPVLLAEKGAELAKKAPGHAIIVTSYELARTSLPKQWSPQMIIMDEAHLLRGRKALKSQFMYELCQSTRFKLALTGTPIWSRPRDWWMLLKILFGYRFGTANDFDEAYCGSFINKWGGKVNTGATRTEELKLRLGFVMLRRTKAEVASELPALTRTVRWVTPTKEAKMACEANALGMMSIYDALATTLAAKLDATVEAMEDAGTSLVFTWRKADAAELEVRAVKAGLEVVRITGDMSHAERQRSVDNAIKSKASVIATIDSIGTGVDRLQYVASTGIFHALDWVPIKLAQAEARLHRIGQALPVNWIYMAMEQSADQYVIAAVVDKLVQWAAILGKDMTSELGEVVTESAVSQSAEAALAAIREEMKNDFS